MKKPWSHQRKAINSLSNGSILVGSTGSGKSLVSLVYFFEKIIGGSIDPPIVPSKSVDLYIITTAMKRDRLDWQKEAASFGISTDRESSINNIQLVVDSWNNVKKYVGVKDAFFVFDEQKTIGYRTWGRSFIKIAHQNQWIMLTATPGDKWIDLMPVMVANKFYRNKTDFVRQHVIYSPYTKFPKIKMYVDTDKLKRIKDRIFVVMPYKREVKIHDIDVSVDHNKDALTAVIKKEWNPYTETPIKNLSEFAYILRRVLNSDPSRISAVKDIHSRAKKLIIFYNYDYELESLREAFKDIECKEHNGHKHDPVPDSDSWVYLVQYLSGNEAWECFTTNHMVFYSLNYAYWIMVQAKGRINRMTSPYENLFYYRLISDHFVDRAILKAIKERRTFNEKDLGINFHPRE